MSTKRIDFAPVRRIGGQGKMAARPGKGPAQRAGTASVRRLVKQGVQSVARPAQPARSAQPAKVVSGNKGSDTEVTLGARPVDGVRKARRPAGAKKAETPVIQPARPAELESQSEILFEELSAEELLLDHADLERPVSEFADLEHLAEEIAEVTAVTDGDETVVETTALSVGTGPASEEVFSLKQVPQYGVVENFQPKFVQTEVNKRPLGNYLEEMDEPVEKPVENSTATSGMKAAGASAGFGAHVAATPRTSAGAVPRMNTAATPVTSREMQIPKTQFINQNKVAKRPLSKNVYAGRGIDGVRAGTGGQHGFGVNGLPGQRQGGVNAAQGATPVKIVSTPKKGGSVGMVFAVIGTILLGAAVGTVAFLLLPK